MGEAASSSWSIAAKAAVPLGLVLIASALAWVLLFVAVPPAAQDFPLNDDWAFARGAFRFAHGGGIDYGNWASMPQIGQWAWAAPFVWLFGESHTALRLSTILLSWVGLAAFYDLLRQRGIAPRRAGLAAATLGLSPLFFLLQGTFMTDVPALSLSLAALALYARALQGGGSRWLVAACFVAVVAAVTRQNALAVPAAAAVLLARSPDLRRRAGWWAAVLLPAAAGAAAHLWLSGRDDVRALAPALPDLPTLLAMPFVAAHLFGLSALPLLAAGWRRPSFKALLPTFAAFLACAGCWLLYGKFLPYGGLFPYAENMLTPWGAFAGSKFTGLLVVGQRPPLLGTPARVVLTLLGCAAGASLVVRAAQNCRGGAWAAPLTFFSLFSLVFILIAPDLYDRYLLFLLPGALALAADAPGAAPDGGPRWRLGVAGVVLLGALSVGLAHDWLSWNAARWALGRRAIARHIDPRDIEGGVEWDAWYAPPGPPAEPDPRWPLLPFTREWFPRVRGRYALSFSELPHARRIDAEPYDLWLIPGPHEFFLMENPPMAPAAPRKRERESVRSPGAPLP